jgi:hypothetical protein
VRQRTADRGRRSAAAITVPSPAARAVPEPAGPPCNLGFGPTLCAGVALDGQRATVHAHAGDTVDVTATIGTNHLEDEP